MSVKSSAETQKPRVANHYVIEPVSPSLAAVSGIDERSPLAPPRSKDAKKSAKSKSATLPIPKKSGPVHKPAPYRPPPPKFTNTSAIPGSPSDKASPTTTLTAPPRRSKSLTKEPVYEALIVKQPAVDSPDTVPEYEECYVEPVDVPEKPKEPAEYLELPSAASSNNEPNNSANASSTASKGNNEIVKSAVADTSKPDEKLPTPDSSNQNPTGSAEKEESKEPVGSADDKEKEKSKDSSRKDQNLTILQAKKMFETKPQSTPNSSKVTSFKVKKTDADQSTEAKATIEQTPVTDASSNALAMPPDQPETAETMAPKQGQSSNMADKKQEENAVNCNVKTVNDVHQPKTAMPTKPSSPALANKPHINGGNQ